jgi:hypothetical protein
MRGCCDFTLSSYQRPEVMFTSAANSHKGEANYMPGTKIIRKHTNFGMPILAHSIYLLSACKKGNHYSLYYSTTLSAVCFRIRKRDELGNP